MQKVISQNMANNESVCSLYFYHFAKTGTNKVRHRSKNSSTI